MSKPHQRLIADVRHRLARAADPAKAGPMQAYMKSAMPYRGVQTPGVRHVCREVFTAHPLRDRSVWEATTRVLFDRARYREERYVAIALTGHRPYFVWQDLRTVPLYDHLVVTGAWWDFVDEIAIRRIGPILFAYPRQMRPILRRWARDQNIWRRRTAILAQIKAKTNTDTKLLADCMGPSLRESDFFLRKGIGWALREHAKIDADWVRCYVERNRDQLSRLSIREALKNL